MAAPTTDSPTLVHNPGSNTMTYSSSGNIDALTCWLLTLGGVTVTALATTGLTWTQRKTSGLVTLQAGQQFELAEWTAPVTPAATLTSKSIQATYSGGTGTRMMAAVGISSAGAGISFDGNASFPAVSSSSGSGDPTLTGLSSNSSTPLVICCPACMLNQDLGTTPPTGFTYDGVSDTAGDTGQELAMAHKGYSSALSSVTLDWPKSLSENMFIADAFIATPPPGGGKSIQVILCM